MMVDLKTESFYKTALRCFLASVGGEWKHSAVSRRPLRDPWARQLTPRCCSGAAGWQQQQYQYQYQQKRLFCVVILMSGGGKVLWGNVCVRSATLDCVNSTGENKIAEGVTESTGFDGAETHGSTHPAALWACVCVCVCVCDAAGGNKDL